MLKIGTTETSYTGQYGYQNGLARMRMHGYDSMDYQEFIVTSTPLFEKSFVEFETYLREQKKIARETGIGIHQAHGPWRWSVQDGTKNVWMERFEIAAKCVEGTAILGCKNLVMHPIMPYTNQDEAYADRTYSMNLDFMGRLTEVAEKYDATICLENLPQPKFSLGRVEAVLAIAQEINSKHFKICLDAGHTVMFSTSAADAVRKIGKDYLYALHLHDGDGVIDRHWSLFSGKVDWIDFGHALYEIGYDGVISLEPGSIRVPPELREHEEIGLYKRAKYIAELASGIRTE